MRSLFTSSFLLLFSFTVLSQNTYSDIAPILFEKCAQCHRDGGGAPFSVLNYEETYFYRNSIYHQVSEGYMPPWAPDTSYMHFVNERALTENEKNAILDWVDAFALEGDTSLLPDIPEFSSTILNGEPDLIINTPTFQSNAFTEDAYNLLVVPSGLSTQRYLRAIEIVPENPELTHHIVFNADNAGIVSEDLSGLSANIEGDIYVGIYTPGGNPIIFPNSSEIKMGISLPAQADLIFQVHTPNYVSTGASYGMDVNIQVRLFFYPEDEIGVREVFSQTPLQYWEDDFYILPNEAKTISTESEPVEFDFSVYNALPHSHKICAEILNYAYEGEDTIPLIKINRWDFNHQEYYYFKNLVKIPAGYTLYSEHTYDNTVGNHHNPFNPPQLISVGPNSNDEMLFDSFQFLQYQEGDELINIDSILSNDPLLTVSGVSEYSSTELFNSYVAPNPLSKSSSIYFPHFDDSYQDYTLDVVNTEGKKVSLDYFVNRGQISFERGVLSSGVYFYSVIDGINVVSSGKFIVVD